MNPIKPFAGAALLLLAAACSHRTEDVSTQTPSTQATSPAEAQAQSSDETPAETAATAAATAPECKDIEKTQPGTCQPSATGNPSAR